MRKTLKSAILTILAIFAINANECQAEDAVTWSYDSSTKTLIISGIGAMPEYGEDNMPWKMYASEAEKCIIEDGITDICSFAFSDFSKITSATMGNTVTTIGRRAFLRCYSLIYVTFSNSLNYIGDYAFCGCHNLESITLPESIESICFGAFNECKKLASVTIPAGLKHIGWYAFSYCSKLETVIWNATAAEMIGEIPCDYTIFKKCSKLRSFVFSDSVKIIPERMFYKQENLNYVTIGNSVNRIKDNAFLKCSDLLWIEVNATTPPTCDNDTVFAKVSKDIPVYVPMGCADVYKEAPAWNQFNNYIEKYFSFENTEWYYSIENADRITTYQHLQYVGDTVIDGKDSRIILRTNIINETGDKEVSREYIYEYHGVLYWWNDLAGYFMILYDMGAAVGDSWTTRAGWEKVTCHVDAIGIIEYDGKKYKTLEISDEDNVFSGTIVCGVGHLGSFFPEKLMSSGTYNVNGLRCQWSDDELVFKQGDDDCDAIHVIIHHGVDENENCCLSVFPNPGNDFINITSNSHVEVQIFDIQGNRILSKNLEEGVTRINTEDLSSGIYIISLIKSGEISNMKWVKE